MDLPWTPDPDIDMADIYGKGTKFSEKGRELKCWTESIPRLYSPTGKEWGEKVLDLRQELKALQMDAMVVTSLDEVAWLLNIRGRDTPYSPLVRAFLIVTPSEIHMYTNQSKIPREVRLHLNTWSCHSENCVRLHYYENITGDLRTFSQGWSRVLIPSDYMYNQGASQAIYSAPLIFSVSSCFLLGYITPSYFFPRPNVAVLQQTRQFVVTSLTLRSLLTRLSKSVVLNNSSGRTSKPD
uniref:Uncharacterized protein n=1 Tax=Timema monikensis TaxID=170555 RepID=A0A7R9HUY2_9NEOP|nr:unnamed protein product [Timema monikensis]